MLRIVREVCIHSYHPLNVGTLDKDRKGVEICCGEALLAWTRNQLNPRIADRDLLNGLGRSVRRVVVDDNDSSVGKSLCDRRKEHLNIGDFVERRDRNSDAFKHKGGDSITASVGYDPGMNYDAVLFDAADTLFTTRGSVGSIYSSVAQKFGSKASPSEIQEAFVRHFHHSGPLTADTEKVWWKDLVHRVFSDVGMVQNFDRFFEEIYDLFRDSRGWMLFEETRQVLEDLRRNQLKLGVISNFDSRLYSVLSDLGILSFFDSVTICSETGAAKPDPEIFRVALQSLRTAPDRTLFAGDSLLDDFQAGQNAGLITFLVDRSGRYADMKSVRRVSNLRELLPIVGVSPNS
jgi:putative hydrolase of the HAD superfamily